MPTVSRRSHIKKGRGYLNKTGRYNEVSKAAKHVFINDAPSSSSQKSLAQNDSNSASVVTLKKVREELGW